MRNDNQHRTNFFLRPNVFYPLSLFFFLFFDGSLTNIFANYFSFFSIQIIPNLLLVTIFFLIHFECFKRFRFWTWLILCGLFFDLYYTESVGIYLTAFLLSAYSIRYLDQRLPYGIFPSTITLLCSQLIFSFVSLAASTVAGLGVIDIFAFTILSLLPSLIFNILIELIFYRPIESLTYIINN